MCLKSDERDLKEVLLQPHLSHGYSHGLIFSGVSDPEASVGVDSNGSIPEDWKNKYCFENSRKGYSSYNMA